MFVDVRTADGHLLFRFDPARMLIEVKRRDQVELVDLTKYIAPMSAKEIASERQETRIRDVARQGEGSGVHAGV